MMRTANSYSSHFGRYKSIRSNADVSSGVVTLLFLYVALKPIYLWESGLPQVADVFMVILIAVHVANLLFSRRVLQKNFFSVCVVFFAYWTLLVNLFAMFIVSETSGFLQALIMNVYNALVAIVVFSLARSSSKKISRAIFNATCIGLGLQLIVIAASGFEVARNTGLFNNPNQLAFYSVLSVCLLLVTFVQAGKKISVVVLGLAVATVTIAFTLSRAGLVAIALILIGTVLWPPGDEKDRRVLRLSLIVIFLGVTAFFLLGEYLADSAWYQFLERRSLNNQSEVFGSGRGYDRLYDNPQYWILGAGEGAYWRFDSLMEFHSTLGNVLMSYGLVGLIAFLTILHASVRVNHYRYTYLIVAILAYGLTHNGLRNTLFWILLALIALPIPQRVFEINRKPKKGKSVI